jgi:hypothetical protein
VNLYNRHWQGFLKFGAALSPICGLVVLMDGIYFVYWGLISWRFREVALERLNSRRHRTLRVLDLQLEAAKKLQQNPSSQTKEGLSPEQIISLRIQLAMDIQQTRGKSVETEARGRRAEADAKAQQAEVIIKKAHDEIEDFKAKRMISRCFRAVSFVSFALGGGISIWFLEETLTLNDIDLNDDIGSSAGQMLALVIATLSTIGFLFEVLKKRLKNRELDEKLRALEDKIDSTVDEIQRGTQQVAKWWSDFEQWSKSKGIQGRQELASGGSGQHGRRRNVWPLSFFKSQRNQQQADPVIIADNRGSMV